MLLYIMALELTDPDADSIKGALYYQYKNFDIKKGLIDEKIAVEDFSLTKRNKSLIQNEKMIELKENFTKQINTILQKLNKNEFSTLPIDFELCKKCDWRKICRAAHLM